MRSFAESKWTQVNIMYTNWQRKHQYKKIAVWNWHIYLPCLPVRVSGTWLWCCPSAVLVLVCNRHSCVGLSSGDGPPLPPHDPSQITHENFLGSLTCATQQQITVWTHVYCTATNRLPCGLRGWKNRPAPFPGRISYKATKPGSVCPLA